MSSQQTMRNFTQGILSMGAEPVYDREAMLREVLAAKLSEWLERKVFYVVDLKEMRSIVCDIQCITEPSLMERAPPDIDRLNHMGFEILSAVNLAESISAALDFIGVTSTTGADLLGEQRWTEIQQKVAVLTRTSGSQAGPQTASISRASPSSSWAQLTLATLAHEVFDGPFFSICKVDQMESALKAVRRASGLPAHEHNEMTKAALRALHCKHWHEEIAPDISAGIKDAIWQVCGIDDQIGPLAFGEHWTRVRGLTVPAAATSAEINADSDEDGSAGRRPIGRSGQFDHLLRFFRRLGQFRSRRSSSAD